MTRNRLWTYLIGGGVLFGLLYRLFPLVAGDKAVREFFITEDGYLMLTAARNLGIGNGLSVSDGTIATNGVQPLATLFYTVPFMITGGEKTGSIYLIILIMVLFSLFGLWAIRQFATDVLQNISDQPVWPWMVAVIWFVSPLMILHTMNALETGLYIAVVVLLITVFGRIAARNETYTRRDQIVLGLLCGLAFWSRNDAVYLIGAIFATRFVSASLNPAIGLRRAFIEPWVPGLLSILIASPWLLHNKILFGSFVPISGTSQSWASDFGQNLPLLPSKLFETIFPMLPIPTSLELSPIVIAITAATCAFVIIAFLWMVVRERHPFRDGIIAYTLFGVVLCFYYGTMFGAPHFLSRYISPLGPLLITAAFYVGLRLFQGRLRGAFTAAVVLAMLLSVALSTRLLLPGKHVHEHFQVVDWVNENVPEEVWAGAVQTGTLGFWHDRTINLDGKVNPTALAILREKGDVLDYVVDTDIQYLADWVGIADWVNRGNQNFTNSFEVVVEDPASNLGVLRRREVQ